MGYPTYLVHYNKNHDKLGRFGSGDGDGDGIVDDHHNQKEAKKAYKALKGNGKNSKRGKEAEAKAMQRARNDEKFVKAKEEFKAQEKKYKYSISKINDKLSRAEAIDTREAWNSYDRFLQKAKSNKSKEYAKAQAAFNKESERIAKEFCGKYADKNISKNNYITMKTYVDALLRSMAYAEL